MILRCGFFMILAVYQVRCFKPDLCDQSLNGGSHEGILGQVGIFPWLGVIRLQLYEGENVRTALSGAILIKEKYALTIADDIARIPKSIFQRDTQALFIPNDGEPWLCKLRRYMTHPEYPTIKNMIALIELELDDKRPATLNPICWPWKSYNASDQMYIFSITNANDNLQKEFYKVQHVQSPKCKYWYRNEGLETESDRRREYQCVAAENSKRQCTHGTGMVLASNATGPWVLLGLGVHGLGCASPARFIDMHKYLPWIEKVTSNLKKSALKEGFGGHDNHARKLIRSSDSDERKAELKRTVPGFFDRYESRLVPEISRIDQDSIILFNSKYELEKGDCAKKSKLIFTDSFKMNADNLAGKAFYQLSLMDLSVYNYTCVLIRVDAKKRKKAKLWYDYGSFIENLEDVDETPKKLMNYQYATTTTKKPRRLGRSIMNNNRRYKNSISDSIINDLQDIKNELEITKKELNATRKADIDKTFRKMFGIKSKLTDVRDKLASPAAKILKNSIDILDNAGNELRASRIYHQGQRMNVKKQKSLDLINQFREQPATTFGITIDEPDSDEEESIQKAKGSQGGKQPWIPDDLLEPLHITEKPGWWLYHPHLNLKLEYQWESEAELIIQIWSHHKKTRPPHVSEHQKTTKIHKMSEETMTASVGGGAGGNGGRGNGGFDKNNLPPGYKFPTGVNTKDVRPDFDINNLPPSVDPKDLLPDFTNKPPGSQRTQFLSNDTKFKTYVEFKRAEYNDLEVIKIRGVDGEEMANESHIVRPERLNVVAVIFCIMSCQLFLF